MITLKELNPKGYTTTEEQAKNLSVLLERINKVREAYAKPMYITSGLRSDADQTRINPKAPKSKHLIGAACDVRDADGSLFKWCQANEALLVEVELWLEHGDYTKGWVHFQIYPPKSGNRFFIP